MQYSDNVFKKENPRTKNIYKDKKRPKQISYAWAYRHASRRALPAGLPIGEPHDSAVIGQTCPSAQAGLPTPLLLKGILEGTD